MNWSEVPPLVASLAAAAFVGAALALHPMRLMKEGFSRIDLDTVRAQILVAASGALMVLVVGDSVARAFGLVGIGSFIRFRTVMKSARETGVLFLLIGLGMACGLRQWPVAVVGTVFFYLLLFLIDLGGEREEKKKKEEPPMPLADEGLL